MNPKTTKTLKQIGLEALLVIGRKAEKSYGVNISKQDDNLTVFCTYYIALQLQVRYTKTI